MSDQRRSRRSLFTPSIKDHLASLGKSLKEKSGHYGTAELNRQPLRGSRATQADGSRKKSGHCGAAELPGQVGLKKRAAAAGRPSYPGGWVQREERPLRGIRAQTTS
eukprot:15459880-Alexandrium_andersonii.AAC.1